MGINTVPLCGSQLPAAVAAYLLQRHADQLPDLSGLTILVPNHRAGRDLARQLALQSGLPALLPPRITPLKNWASQIADAEPQARRLARLHGVLRREAWLGAVDRWTLAHELLALADELSAARIGSEIGTRLRTQQQAFPDSETRLIEAVWRALNQDDSNPQACYARQLDSLLDATNTPLYGYALGPLTALERQFLERYAAQSAVLFFSLDTHASPRIDALHQTWCESDTPLIARAAALAARHPESPLHAGLALYAAPHLEACARAVASWVAAQLHAGRRAIALIALDRETARRTRALLERLDVQIADETGWTLTTTAAAAVIARWLDCVARDFPHGELLDLMKSPFVFDADAARQDAVLALELALRQHGVAQGMAQIRRLAREAVPAALPWLDRLAASAQQFGKSRVPLAAWLARLATSLDAIGAAAPLAADAAGAHVLETLDRAAHELADDDETYSLAEWRRWLDMTLENASFTDSGIDSPVVLTSLPAARGRAFEAVAVIGADARHLPAPPAVGLFSQGTRSQLGLPTAAEARAQTLADLLQLLSQGPSLLCWQARSDDEPRPASPLIVQLQAMHRAAWHTDLAAPLLAIPAALDSPLPPLAAQPAPVVAAANLPRRYSPTAYQTLLDCPYRFFARSVLGLKQLDEADDALDKSDYGNALHRILKRFHDSAPPTDAAAALHRLEEFSTAEFAAAPPYQALAWETQWAAIAPAYIDAWLLQVNAGWQYEAGETGFEQTLDVPALGTITLAGRVDRIDRNGDARQVIDYKTSSAARLKQQRDAPAEHVQLPFYAWLCDAAAVYLPINDSPVTPLALDGECPVEAIALRLRDAIAAAAQGAGLPANGVDAVCTHCEARGLCRKGMWGA